MALPTLFGFLGRMLFVFDKWFHRTIYFRVFNREYVYLRLYLRWKLLLSIDDRKRRRH